MHLGSDSGGTLNVTSAKSNSNFPISTIFEVHLSVSDREASIKFFRDLLGMQLGDNQVERDVAFMWIGKPGTQMLGLWGPKCPNPPISNGHSHFAMTLEEGGVEEALNTLKEKGIEPLDLNGNPTLEPIVFGWMPAMSIFFRDPDGHLLEFISMLPDAPRSEIKITGLKAWRDKTCQAEDWKRYAKISNLS